MLRINGHKNYAIFYECDCGTKGKCLVRPLGKSGSIIVDIKCAMCSESKRAVIYQDGEEAKLSTNPEDIEYQAAFVLENKILKR